MSFDQRLRRLRLDKGYTQASFARALGLTRDLYNKYELAGVHPSQKTLAHMAELLDTTTDFLITGSDERNYPAVAGLDPAEDAAYYRFSAKAKKQGISAEDLELALDFIKRAKARERDAQAKASAKNI